MALEADQLKALIENVVSSALAVQRENFEEKLKGISGRINEIETFKEIEIIPGKHYDESLDVIKSLPDFEGKHENYVSWRQAVHNAYKIFENFVGSSKQYQAVAISKSKIKGPADMVLASFNTVLNFRAITSRLDFTYSDERPIYLIEQELSTLRQGNIKLLQYYDEVERKLTLLTNKTITTYDSISSP
uniref:Retrovirus-related Gag polyprotein from transposon gypsy n=1 Tax=Ceratitis capitata TaxID=7213 RepID=W8BK27_CERCA